MKSIHDIRRDNLRHLIDSRFSGSQTKFAQAVGLKQPSFVSRLLTDSLPTRKNIGTRLARSVEIALGLSTNFLDTPGFELERPIYVRDPRAGHLDLGLAVEPTRPSVSEQEHVSRPTAKHTDRRVRLLSAQELGQLASIAVAYEATSTGDMITVHTASAPSAVALQLGDDAMGERFPAGSIVVIEHTTPPTANSFVVGVLPGAQVATMRQWAEAADRRFLIPLNRAYQATELTTEFRLLGVVIEAILFF